MSISSLSSSSAVQHTINNSSTCVYEHFEVIIVTFATLVNIPFDKIITTHSPKSHNPVKSEYFIQILSIMLAVLPTMLALCSMLLPPYYVQNYAGIIYSSLYQGP